MISSPAALTPPIAEASTRPSARSLCCLVVTFVVFVVALMVVPALSAASSSAQPRDNSDDAQIQLQQVLDNVVAAGAPGVVTLINGGRPRHDDRDRHDVQGKEERHGRAIRTGGSGVADLRTGRAIRAAHRFRAGSGTKPFVATVMLQLVGEGRLSLQDTVERWLPGMLPYGDQITVRQLLNHTSGIPDYIEPTIAELFNGDRLRSWRPQELVALVADRPPHFPAGTAWSYSNTGYLLAGLIIERITGNQLGRELERRIFHPLRLGDTSFPTQFPFIVGPHTRGYALHLDDELNPIEGPLFDITDYNPSFLWASGNIVSNVDDLARFFGALLGGQLLKAQQLADMKTPIEIAPGYGYGLGLAISDSPCGPLFGHDGGVPGYHNFVLNSEDGRHQVAVMRNAEKAPAAVWEPIDRVTDYALGEAFAGEPCAAVSARDELRQDLGRLVLQVTDVLRRPR